MLHVYVTTCLRTSTRYPSPTNNTTLSKIFLIVPHTATRSPNATAVLNVQRHFQNGRFRSQIFKFQGLRTRSTTKPVITWLHRWEMYSRAFSRSTTLFIDRILRSKVFPLLSIFMCFKRSKVFQHFPSIKQRVVNLVTIMCYL
jgi:hypothetical protein